MKEPELTVCYDVSMKAKNGLKVGLCVAGAAFAGMAFGTSAEGLWAPSCEGAAPRLLKRLPVEVLPENAFDSLGNAHFDDPACADVETEKLGIYETNATFNVVTLTLRCKPDLNDPRTKAKVADYVREAHAHGIRVMMDVDPRIARHAFLAAHPDECERVVHVVRVRPDKDGRATASAARTEQLNDHMSWGSAKAYDATSASLLGGWAVRADGSKRRVQPFVTEATANRCAAECAGFAADEDFVALFEFRLHSIDVFSPLLLPYTRELMEAYRALGVDGAMKDEWGHPPSYSFDPLFERNVAHWYSPHYAEAYAQATGGRVLADDLVEMTFGGPGAEAMVDAYNRVNLERNVAIERHHYFTVKELFGDDTYVTKHSTWWGSLSWPEFRHDGLDWWQAKRDWAQTDETTAVPVMLSLAKKFGKGWLNEGYQNAPEKYAVKLWQYALAGGRMVYHGVFPQKGPRYETLSPRARILAGKTDILRENAAVAQSRIRLANVLSDSVADSPVAFVFGHMNLMNWLKKDTYADWGADKVAALTSAGWLTDAYPSSELKNFAVDSAGWLKMGVQKYRALVLYHPDEADAQALGRRLASLSLKTRVFTVAKEDGMEDIIGYLEQCGAGRQPAVCTGGQWDMSQYPKGDGTLRLVDGTRERFKGVDSSAGDPIAGALDVDGVKVAYRAVGFFGARAKDGQVEAFGGAQVTEVDLPGLTLRLPSPEDFVLRRDGQGWAGVLQRVDVTRPVPAELLAVTPRWTLLKAPDPF